MTASLFFCGEVVADMVEADAGSGDFKLKLGGSQFHGSIGAARRIRNEQMDAQSYFVGPVSQDTFGERFIEFMQEESVRTNNISRVDRNTTLAIVSIRPGHENHFVFYGRDTAEQMTQPHELPGMLEAPGPKLCIFGSISTVMEPARFTWQEFAKRQKEEALVYYDLNTRPAIAKDPARYRQIVSSWAAIADVIKASDADIGWTYPGETPEQVAHRWFDDGAKLAVITMGSKGSIAFTPTTTAFVEGQAVEVKNTIGAGDNFNAGFNLGLVRQGIVTRDRLHAATEAELKEALRYANETARNHLMRQAGMAVSGDTGPRLAAG